MDMTTPGNVTSIDSTSAYVIAGTSGGIFVLLLIIITVLAVCCKGKLSCCTSSCSCDGLCKEKPKIPTQPKINLDSVVTTDTYKTSSLVDEKAVEKIHSKSNFNLKRLIGKALAKQVENVLLDSSLLTMGDTLGEGNFGVVYKGILTNERGTQAQVVAVKSITGDTIGAKEMSAFIEEVMRMRHFSDLHVLNMIGLVIERNMPMIVMPFMSNGDLRTFVANPKNALLARDLADYGRQVADGMNYLSNQGFVHRDLAARNCMVDGHYVVKVADFGLSRDIFNAEYYKGDEGTPLPVRWMAIESLRSTKFSVKSDVWSYGVLLWELFTRGAKPYPGLDNATVIIYVKSGKRMKQPPHAPDDIYVLMTECWNENPVKRPTFRDLSTTLKRLILAGEHNPSYANIANTDS